MEEPKMNTNVKLSLFLRFFLCLCLVYSCSYGDVVGGSNNKEQVLEQLQGEWILQAAMSQGTEIEIPEGKELMFHMEGNMLVPEDSPDDPAKITLNTGKKPAWIDMTDIKGETIPGVYKIENDKWYICISEPGKPRPETVEPSIQNKYNLMVLSRPRK